MNSRSEHTSLYHIAGKDIFIEVDRGTQPKRGDLVAVDEGLGGGKLRCRQWTPDLGPAFGVVVREYDSYFHRPEWRAQTQERVEASARVLPRMPKPKRARSRRVYFPKWLAA